MRMAFASSHSQGTTPSFNVKLNSFASGMLICSTGFMTSFGGVASSPGDLLLTFSDFIFLATFFRSYS